MSIASEITRINTNIANSYTAVDNKNGTLPQVQNSANLASAIDSIEVIEQATAEGESLSLANTKAMPYSDYVVEGKSEQDGEPSPSNPSEIHSVADEGTVTIKQRGKNLFDYNQIISSASMSIENGGFVINNTDFQNGYFIGVLKNLCPELKVGDKFKFNWDTNATRNNSDVNYIYLNLYANTIKKDITYICTQEMLDSETYFYGQQGEYYKDIIFYLDGQTSDYEPYFSKDYTFQTEPLRSLPNGVKDTIEVEQHRKIGKQTGTLTETTTITLSDAKTNGAYMCNIKPSGTLTGKTIELEAGDYEIIYELEEEIIEPLTQNQATTMLDIIKTGSYEGTTNIYTDEDVKPTIGVGYYKKG